MFLFKYSKKHEIYVIDEKFFYWSEVFCFCFRDIKVLELKMVGENVKYVPIIYISR